MRPSSGNSVASFHLDRSLGFDGECETLHPVTGAPLMASSPLLLILSPLFFCLVWAPISTVSFLTFWLEWYNVNRSEKKWALLQKFPEAERLTRHSLANVCPAVHHKQSDRVGMDLFLSVLVSPRSRKPGPATPRSIAPERETWTIRFQHVRGGPRVTVTVQDSITARRNTRGV